MKHFVCKSLACLALTSNALFSGVTYDCSIELSDIVTNISNEAAKEYEKSPYVCDDVWGWIQPYLLPANHPVKAALDKIFNKSRAHESQEAMKKAGFLFKMMGKKRIIVARHFDLWGYLIKTYLDTDDVSNLDWHIWRHRVDGANYIRDCIQRHNYNHIMKVPKKWVYPIPPLPTSGPHRQHFLLVVEDMHILSNDKNKEKYKKMREDKLEALYTVLNECLLIDSIYIQNVPFCQDGKMAFVDTEHFNTTSRPVRYHRITPFLSQKMRHFWEGLTGGSHAP